MNEADRRNFQRLKLAKPILATLAGHSALILDIGMSGAFIEHYGTVAPGNRFSKLGSAASSRTKNSLFSYPNRPVK